MSLRMALDQARHEAKLRCIVPPPGAEFAGGGGGDAAPRGATRRIPPLAVPPPGEKGTVGSAAAHSALAVPPHFGARDSRGSRTTRPSMA